MIIYVEYHEDMLVANQFMVYPEIAALCAAAWGMRPEYFQPA